METKKKRQQEKVQAEFETNQPWAEFRPHLMIPFIIKSVPHDSGTRHVAEFRSATNLSNIWQSIKGIWSACSLALSSLLFYTRIIQIAQTNVVKNRLVSHDASRQGCDKRRTLRIMFTLKINKLAHVPRETRDITQCKLRGKFLLRYKAVP